MSSRKIGVFQVRKKFAVVSITGSYCYLRCKHCNARYLSSMIPSSPKLLRKTIDKLYTQGVRGILLSGGFNKDGYLPIGESINDLEYAKKLGFVINAHLGFIDKKDLLYDIKELIDVVDFEFTLSRNYIANTRGKKFSPETYKSTIENMVDAGLNVVPHLFLWHPWSSLDLLIEEINFIKNLGINTINTLVYIPSFSTYLDKERLLPLITSRIKWLRHEFEGNIYMGCMRPHILKKELDSFIVEKRLVERIANPHPLVIKKFHNDIELFDACCSIPNVYIERFKVVKD